MKVAITSTGNSPDSTLDSRFGRCSYFVIYDTETHATEYIPNQNKENVEGAGPASVQLIASKGAEKVVSGEFGAKVKSLFDRKPDTYLKTGLKSKLSSPNFAYSN